MDLVQARLDELLRRLESQESLIRTLQATQVSLHEEPPKTAWWTTEAKEPQRQRDDDAWWTRNGQWTGQGWSQSWNNWSNASWSNTKPTDNPATVPTWNADAQLFDDYAFDVFMYKRGSNPGDRCFLVPRLISGLTGGARKKISGWLAILIFSPLKADLKNSLNPQKDKNNGYSSTTGNEMACKKYICEIKRARGESMTSWINRPDEALMDMKEIGVSTRCTIFRTNYDPSTNSRMATSSQERDCEIRTLLEL